MLPEINNQSWANAAKSTETTPLLESKSKVSFGSIIPYLICFSFCFLLNLVPLALKYVPAARDTIASPIAQMFVFAALQEIQDILWWPIALLLEETLVGVISHLPDAKDREAISKIASVGAILKVMFLNMTSIIMSTTIALSQSGQDLRLSFVVAMMCPVLMGMMMCSIFLRPIEDVQKAKDQRKKKIKKETKDIGSVRKTTICMTVKLELLQSVWRILVLLVSAAIMGCFVASQSEAIYSRIILQLWATERAFSKVIQSLPKARPLIEIMWQGGIVRITCAGGRQISHALQRKKKVMESIDVSSSKDYNRGLDALQGLKAC